MTYAIPRSDPYATLAIGADLLLFSLLCSLRVGRSRKFFRTNQLPCPKRPIGFNRHPHTIDNPSNPERTHGWPRSH